MQNNVLEALRVLSAEQVDFVVIGGIAAVMHGTPVVTLDLDILYAVSPENAARLASALKSLDAHFRSRPDFKPQASHLESRGHKLLMTRCGPLDVLGFAGNNHDFDYVAARSLRVQIGSEATVLVADLPVLIQLKREVGHAKDIAMIPLLEATLRARSSEPSEQE